MGTDELDFQRALAKFGINTALACQAYQAWDKGGGQGIDENELVEVYTKSFGTQSNIPRQLVAAVMNEVRKGENKDASLSIEELVKIMSTGLVSLDRLPEDACERRDKIVPSDE